MREINHIPKNFDPTEAEKRIYADWMEKGYFETKIDPNKKSYTIVMPPPNITGQLHMGHALDNTLQDILTRFKRMQGYAALWVPGTDHASIATEARIVQSMREEGVTKDELGREKFLERAWEWKKNYGDMIINQLKRLGSSCDWNRTRFTMDEGLSQAVEHVFISLYNKGLIYRGKRMINWCITCLTTISDAEVEYEDQISSLWHLRYPIENSTDYMVLATSRPETMLGDVAVAVNPDDERYKHLIGKNVILPLKNKKIPIIADSYVDKDFGTGVVKITPAHDPNDYAVGLRHNLPIIDTFTPDGHLNAEGEQYEGLDLTQARKAIVKDLEAADLIEKIEPYEHSVGTCYRCNTNINPRLSMQWFVKMEPLAEPAIKAVKEKDTQFVPERFDKTYFNWMENIKDWCISRQLWWGHRIPAYYCQDCSKIVVSDTMPTTCPHCQGHTFKQDPDTLDTWFSSALWPFSVFGWPKESEELDYFYPTQVLVTGYDIIFFWVARMIFSALEFTGEVPFHTVFIHGLVRDEQGRKMSKSLMNGIDPLEIIDTYGSDPLRYSLIVGTAPGADMRFKMDKIESSRNFINKIWNAFRFTSMHMSSDSMDFSNIDSKNFQLEDTWILSRLQKVIEEVTINVEKYEFGIGLAKIYNFVWEEFCDWYIEMVKPRLQDETSPTRLEGLYVLNQVLSQSLKLLHPFMPFFTTEIYAYLNQDENLMMSSWPTANPDYINEDAEEKMLVLMEVIRHIRNTRANLNVKPSQKASLILVTDNPEIETIFEAGKTYLDKLAGISDLRSQKDKKGIPAEVVSGIFDFGDIYIPLADLVNIAEEIQRLEKEKEQLAIEIKRVEGKLKNEKFVSKAPEAVVQVEKDKEAKFKTLYSKVSERIEALKQNN